MSNFKSAHSNLWNYKVSSKTKKKKKKLERKMLYFGSLARMLKKYCHISNKRPPNCVIRTFRAKLRILKFGTKNCLILVCWAAILKNHCHIWNQHPRICLVAKFRAKHKKFLNLRPKLSDFHILELEFENILVIFEISTLEFA